MPPYTSEPKQPGSYLFVIWNAHTAILDHVYIHTGAAGI